MRVVGVAIEAGTLSLAAVEPSTDPAVAAQAVADGVRRVAPNDSLDDAHKQVDLTHRIEQELRALDATHVSLSKTRKFSSLAYADALARVTAMCALMAACVECDVDYRELTTDAIAKRVGGLAKALQDTSPTLFGFSDTPTHWRTGLAKAFCAGAARLPATDAS